MDTLSFILFILFIVIIAVAIYMLNRRRKESRRRELAGWAFSRGLNFIDANDHEMEDRYPHFKCLQQGKHRYAYNIIEGSIDNRGICAFDYHYETSDGKNTQDHYFSALVIDSGLPLKPLFIRDETIFDKVADFFGFDDIDFESSEFSKKFYVKSPDRKWAYDVLHQETMEFLLGSPRFTLEFHGKHVIAYRKNTFTVKDFEGALHLITGILNRLPKSLVQELKERK